MVLTTTGHFSNTNILPGGQLGEGEGHRGQLPPPATPLAPPMLVMHGQNLSDEEWRNHYFEKTQRKRKRNSGQAYINAVGKRVSAKSMQVVNCTKCRFHCSENFSEEKRLQIFTQYYALADYSRQKDFLASHIVEASPKRLGSSAVP